jgi:hypothetical protein
VRGVVVTRREAATPLFLESATITLGGKLPLGELGLVSPVLAKKYDLRDAVFLVGLLAAFALQVVFAVRLISRATDAGAAKGIGILVIVCFLIGIARAWELIGGPSIGLGHEVTEIVRARSHHGSPVEAEPPPVEPLEER